MSCAFPWIKMRYRRNVCFANKKFSTKSELSVHSYCFHFAIRKRSQLSLEHQSVSVGHYLLHPNNREFSSGTRPALANHQRGALLLTPDLSTHTMFRPYISAEVSVSFFFLFEIYPETAWKQ